MIDGLKEKHRDAIIGVLSQNSQVDRAVLFGSRATETFTPSSDVDLALFGDKLTLTDQAKIASAIEELPIPQKVDLLIYQSLENDSLREHIDKSGIELYCRRNTNSPSQGKLRIRGPALKN